jgi:hypothetical protein
MHFSKLTFQKVVCVFLVVFLSLCIFYFSRRRESILFQQDFEKGVSVDHHHHHHYKKRTDSQHCVTTFVTAYFDIPSKHSRQEYEKWISNQGNTCLLIFTDAPELWAVAGQMIIHTSLRDEGRALNMSSEFWNKQRLTDPESMIHKSPWLYIIWNLKPYFISTAVRLNPFSSEYFFWIDAGYTRTPKIGNARSLVPVLKNNNTVYFMLIEHFTRQEMIGNFQYTTGMDRIAGNMFGGHGSAVRSWSSLYYTVFNEYVKKGWFVGKDQNIMNTLCVEHPSMCSFFSTLVCYYNEDVWFTMWDCLLHQCSCTVHQFDQF